MTCIAALVDGGRVWVGGDSAGVAGYDITTRSDPKVFKLGRFLIGFTSSFRMGQLLRYGFTPPDHDPRTPDHEYLVTKFVEAVRTRFKEAGYAEVSNNQETGGYFIVGYKGGLYVIEGDYQVGIPADGICAVGCGDNLALGSLFSTKGQPPRERIRTALEAAERYSAGVRSPFTILELKA